MWVQLTLILPAVSHNKFDLRASLTVSTPTSLFVPTHAVSMPCRLKQFNGRGNHHENEYIVSIVLTSACKALSIAILSEFRSRPPCA